MKILIIEDDVKLAKLISRGLAQGGHAIDLEHDGISGRSEAQNGSYDVVVVDVMLPGMNGLALVRELRTAGVKTPVLMLTARDTTQDVIAGLDAGADDYLRKPFAFSELEARLRTLARRSETAPRIVLRVDDIVFDTTTKHVERAGIRISLTSRELAYLEYFMKNPGIVVTRRMLENALWDREIEIGSNAIDVYVGRLRAKLELDGKSQLFTTVRGIGYRFGSS